MQSILVTSFDSLYHVCGLSDGSTKAPWDRLIGDGPWSVPVAWLRERRLFSLHRSYRDQYSLVASAAAKVFQGLNSLIRSEFDDGLWWPLLNADELLVPDDQSRLAWLHGNQSWREEGFGPRYTDIAGWTKPSALAGWHRTAALRSGGIAHYHGARGRILVFWSPSTADDGTVVTGGLWVWADAELRSKLGLPPE